MDNHNDPIVPIDVEAAALSESLAESYLPPEDAAAAERAGAFYEDARREAEYVLEGGDAKSAIHGLQQEHGGYGIDRSDLQDHPAQLIAQALSDEMNASRITNRRSERPARKELRY